MTVPVARLLAIPAQSAPADRFSALVVVADGPQRALVAARLWALGAGEVLEAAGVAEARARIRGLPPPQLAVVEAALPDGTGPSLLAELRARGQTRGLLLAATGDPYTVRAALAAGARGFVVAPPPATPTGAAGTHGSDPGPTPISLREAEVLQLVADGHANREIGLALGLSALTVKSHLARIARKLGTGDRAAMVALALRAGVIR